MHQAPEEETCPECHHQIHRCQRPGCYGYGEVAVIHSDRHDSPGFIPCMGPKGCQGSGQNYANHKPNCSLRIEPPFDESNVIQLPRSA